MNASGGMPHLRLAERKANMVLIEMVKSIAARKLATPAQVALAWLLVQQQWIMPIPVTAKLHRLEENLDAIDRELTAEDLQEIVGKLANIQMQGFRLPKQFLAMSDH